MYAQKEMAVFMLFCAGMMYSSQANAGPIAMYYDATNPNAKTATDLQLTFNKKVVNTGGGQPKPKGAQSTTFTLQNVRNNNMTIVFDAQGKEGVKQNNHSLGVVSLEPGDNKVAARLTKAEWSYTVGPNVEIKAPNIEVGIGKVALGVGNQGNGFITITNTDTQIVYFSNVKASTDILSSNFLDPSSSQLMADIDNELFATGSVSDFSLLPGQSETINLGSDLGDNYTAVVFTEDFSPIPSPYAMRIGFASDQVLAPEPASMTMLGIGAAVMGGYGWRRRKQIAYEPSHAVPVNGNENLNA